MLSEIYEMYKETLSKSEHRIFSYLLEHEQELPVISSDDIARQLGVSTSTISRFWTKIGFKNLKDLKRAVYENQSATPFSRLSGALSQWGEEGVTLDFLMDRMSRYMEKTFRISAEETKQAIRAGNQAQELFRKDLKKKGEEVLKQVETSGKFAVVLASRPYQNDTLVNHELPEIFTGMGIPVLTADSLPGTEEEDLSMSRLDVVNNFHARMLSSAIMAAQKDSLEYVQIVSFGCGHDAYLSDEIVRLMDEISGKTLLILKVDESDIQGPLRIRVRSFLETVIMRREQGVRREI